jgi:4a-hydroxytetrahydrobiopterin dehydratase
VNAVAWIAHVEDHHPDLEVSYGKVVVRYHTHAAGGLTLNDFVCAAKINRLLDSP